jgi:WD40 repeat protein
MYLAGGAFYGYVYLYIRNSSKPIIVHGGEQTVLGVALSDDGGVLVAGTYTRKVMLFNSSARNLTWSYESNDSVRAVDISADGQRIIAGANDGSVLIFGSRPEPIRVYKSGGMIRSVSISKDGSRALSGGLDSTVRMFDSVSGRSLWNSSSSGGITTTSISSNGTIAVAGSQDGKLYVFRNHQEPIREFQEGFEVISTAISASGDRILSAGGSRVHDYEINFSVSMPTTSSSPSTQPSNRESNRSTSVILTVATLIAAIVLVSVWWMRRKRLEDHSLRQRRGRRNRKHLPWQG